MTDEILILPTSKIQEEPESPELLELNKFNNLKQTLERLAGKTYILAFVDPETGAPNIVPSEEISDMELIYLAEMIKHLVFMTSTLEGVDPDGA